MSITLTAIGADVEDRPAKVSQSIRAQRVIEKAERDLGGREIIIAELLKAPKLEPQYRQLLELLYDPRFDKLPLAHLCERVGVTPGDLFAAFRDATIAISHIHAVRMIAARLPTVITHLIDQAETHQAPCPECEGHKTEGSVCPRCKDRGTVRTLGDKDQQKVVLELMGLLKKGVGFQITDNSQTTINQQQNNLAAGTSLFDLQKAVGAVLHRQPLRLVPKDDSASAESAVVVEGDVV